MRVRRGHLLVEALMALVLSAVLAGAAALALSGARRSLHAAERRDRAERAEREAVAILREALAAGDAILTRGDTAVDLDVLLGFSMVCALEPRAVLLPPTEGASPLTVLGQEPTRDDLLALRMDDAEERWWYGVIDSVQSRVMPGRCDHNDGWQPGGGSVPVVRVVLLDTIPSEARVGATVRLARRGRFTLYHAGSGEWMLGWRRCHPWLEVCGVVQPVAGPLRTPSAGGLKFVHLTAPQRIEIRASGADGGRGARAAVHR
jgi:type II secretory pathway pseudopilin PulG